jgi:hypothetical protein
MWDLEWLELEMEKSEHTTPNSLMESDDAARYFTV